MMGMLLWNDWYGWTITVLSLLRQGAGEEALGLWPWNGHKTICIGQCPWSHWSVALMTFASDFPAV